MDYISLFSGIGGFERGIENSNKNSILNCVGYSEIDKYAENIYRKHYPNHPRLGDATKIQTKNLPDFDLLVGGFPCQAFSHAGLRRGFDDTRGTLFFEIARILSEKKPKYFLLENVRGLLSHDKGRTFQEILRTLSELGYNAQWQILNSKDYGVPQNRERIYIKGFLRGRDGRREVLCQPKGGRKVGLSQNKKGLIRLNEKSIDRRDKEEERIYSPDGISPTLNTVGNRLHIDVDEEKTKELFDVAECYGSTQKNAMVTDGKISPTLCAAMGEGGGHVPMLRKVGNVSKTGKSASGNIYDPEGLFPTILHVYYKHNTGILLKNNTKKGYIEANDGDEVLLTQPRCRGRVQEKSTPALTTKSEIGVVEYAPYDAVKLQNTPKFTPNLNRGKIAQTVRTNKNVGVVDKNYQIRRLTPIECERLQGFPDNWTKYGENGDLISDTQRYKVCGNAVTTNVITAIFDLWELKE